jgi:hypothetical protein
MFARRALKGSGRPVYVGGQVKEFSSGTVTAALTFSLTNGAAAAPALGDLVVIAIAGTTSGTPTITASSGGTYTAAVSVTNGTKMRIWYKFNDGDTAATFGGFTWATDALAICVHVWRGVSSVVADATATTATGTSSAGGPADYLNPPAITPVTDGALVLVVGALQPVNFQTLAGTSFTRFIGVSSVNTYKAQAALAAVETWTSGAYDPPAFNIVADPSNATNWITATLAIRPE